MPYSYRTRTNNRRSPSPYHSSNRNSRRSSSRGHKKYIDPARFVQSAKALLEDDYIPTHTFGDFKLHDILKRNVLTKGYTIPSPVQDQTIPAALDGQDIIGIASTGTGKTAAFALPILNALMTDLRKNALIIAPTRELAAQIETEIRALGAGTRLWTALIIGGTNMGTQLRALKQHPRIVIGTPGRIKDHVERRTLNPERFNIVVLDEVDRMLDMGFVKDVTEILSHTNSNRQSMFFSATIDAGVRTLIDGFTTNPHTVALKPSSTSENVHQDVVKYRTSSDKLEALHDILLREAVAKVIIFDETQRSVERLNTELNNRGFDSVSIHGGKTQGQRKRALQSFKDNHTSILVATDVAARGIDVADITHIINYTTPNDYEDYIHRIGRAGRAGRVGYALTFISD